MELISADVDDCQDRGEVVEIICKNKPVNVISLIRLSPSMQPT